MPDYPNNSFAERAWNKLKEVTGFKAEPVTLARSISTNDRVATPEKPLGVEAVGYDRRGYGLAAGIHGSNEMQEGNMSFREQQHRYDRHQEKFAVKDNNTSAVSHNGALSYTSSGKTESISRVGEANRIHKAIDKENAARDRKASSKQGLAQ